MWHVKHSGMAVALPNGDSGFRVFLTGQDASGQRQIGWLDLDDTFGIARGNPGNPVLTAGRMAVESPTRLTWMRAPP